MPPQPPQRMHELVADLRELLRHARYLEARDVHTDLLGRLRDAPADCPEAAAVRGVLEGELRAALDGLGTRAAEVDAALRDLESDTGAGGGGSGHWIAGGKHFGVVTSYRFDDGDADSLWVKMEGELDDPEMGLFELLSVMREVELFRTWMPYCNKSQLLKRLGPAELLAHFNIAVPLLSRETCIHAYGADCTYSHNVIVLMARSIETWDDDVPLPRSKTTWSHDLMDVRAMTGYVRLTAPGRASMTVVINVDPRAPLPKKVVNFFMRNLAGVLLYLMQRTARKVGRDPDNEHGKRIRRDRPFYLRWLLPKYMDYCVYRGWGLPCVPSLGLHRDDLPPEFMERLEAGGVAPSAVAGLPGVALPAASAGTDACGQCRHTCPSRAWLELPPELREHVMAAMLTSFMARGVRAPRLPDRPMTPLGRPASASSRGSKLRMALPRLRRSHDALDDRSTFLSRVLGRARPRKSYPETPPEARMHSPSPGLQRRLEQLKARRMAVDDSEPAVMDRVVDWFLWPLVPVVFYLLPYDDMLLGSVRESAGFVAEMVVLAVLQQLLMVVVGAGGVRGLQSVRDRRLRRLAATERLASRAMAGFGLVLVVLGAAVGAAAATARSPSNAGQAWCREWNDTASLVARWVATTGTLLACVALAGVQAAARFLRAPPETPEAVAGGGAGPAAVRG